MKKSKINPAPSDSHSDLPQHSRDKFSRCGIKALKREEKKKPKMKVSGKSVFKIQEIIIGKSGRHKA